MKKYCELPRNIKIRLQREYIKGWLVTHPDEVMELEDADELLNDSDVLYDDNGNMID